MHFAFENQHGRNSLCAHPRDQLRRWHDYWGQPHKVRMRWTDAPRQGQAPGMWSRGSSGLKSSAAHISCLRDGEYAAVCGHS